MAAPASHIGHKRKISFADLAQTYARAGPIVAPPHSQPHPPPPNPAEFQRQQLEMARRNDLARRQAKKPTDKEIPEELSEVIVGDGVERYRKLRDVEQRLDAVMMRKRLDVKDNLQRSYTRREGTLRVWISNTAEGQPWQVVEEGGGMNEDGTFDFGENSEATYRVKIEGRLLEDSDSEEEDKPSPAKRPRLSDFFKAITVDFDRNPALQPDGYSQIEWRKPDAGPQSDTKERDFDTLEFERKGDENMNVTINLTRDEKSKRFKLSPQLAEILDMEEEDTAGVVQGIWEYVRAMNLQEDEDKRSIVCDEPLRKLFNKDTLYFPYLPDLIAPHLLPLPPIQLPYTIRVDKPYIAPGSSASTNNGIGGADDIFGDMTNDLRSPSPSKPSDSASAGLAPSLPKIYDIKVPLPNPLQKTLTRFQLSRAHVTDLQTITKTDEDLALLVQKLNQTNAKRKFYESLAKDPTNFIKRWISSQQRDMEVILAEATRGGGEEGSEEFRRGGEGGLWGGTVARESVGLWLARGAKAG